jgi:hypothetical protein
MCAITRYVKEKEVIHRVSFQLFKHLMYKILLKKSKSTLLTFLYINLFLFRNFMQSSARCSFRRGFCSAQNAMHMKKMSPNGLKIQCFHKIVLSKTMLNIKANPYWNGYWEWAPKRGIAGKNPSCASYMLKRSMFWAYQNPWRKEYLHENLGGRGPKNEQFCISVWPETQFQIFQNLFHRQITSCTAILNDIWHTLRKIIVCMHCSFKKWLTAIYIYPHPAKITPKIYQYGQTSWRCSILQNPPDSFTNISNTQCKLWHFQKDK